jgi:hypothetical protein
MFFRLFRALTTGPPQTFGHEGYCNNSGLSHRRQEMIVDFYSTRLAFLTLVHNLPESIKRPAPRQELIDGPQNCPVWGKQTTHLSPQNRRRNIPNRAQALVIIITGQINHANPPHNRRPNNSRVIDILGDRVDDDRALAIITLLDAVDEPSSPGLLFTTELRIVRTFKADDMCCVVKVCGVRGGTGLKIMAEPLVVDGKCAECDCTYSATSCM